MQKIPTMTIAELEALPEFSIGGETLVITDPLTGMSTYELVPQKFLVQRDMVYFRDQHDELWSAFTDQDGTTWKQRGM